MSSLKPLDAEELDPNAQYLKVKAKRVEPIEKQALDDGLVAYHQGSTR